MSKKIRGRISAVEYGPVRKPHVQVEWDGDDGPRSSSKWAVTLADFGLAYPSDLLGRRVEAYPDDQFVYPEGEEVPEADPRTGEEEFTREQMERIESAVRESEYAFWQSVAATFPEAESGDLLPGDVAALQDAMKYAVMAWFQNNVPKQKPTAVNVTPDFEGVLAWVKRLEASDIDEDSRDQAAQLLMLASSVNRDAPVGELLDLLGIEQK